MKTFRHVLIAAGALLTVMVLLMPESPAMVDEVLLSNPEFEPRKRPPIIFYHDAHNEAAGLYDCSVCHHVYENGQLVEGLDSTDTPWCSDCHTVNPTSENTVPLLLAYHGQCRGCHLESKAGPIACGECHKRTSFF
jgi:hypothetical protein